MPLSPIGPKSLRRMDSPIARNLISSLAFKSLTSGAFNFFRARIPFSNLTRLLQSLAITVRTFASEKPSQGDRQMRLHWSAIPLMPRDAVCSDDAKFRLICDRAHHNDPAKFVQPAPDGFPHLLPLKLGIYPFPGILCRCQNRHLGVGPLLDHMQQHFTC